MAGKIILKPILSGILSELKWRRCFPAKMKAEEDSGITAKPAKNTDLSHLDAIQDYALAVARDMLTNGHQCLPKD